MVAISGGQQRQDWYAIPGVPLTLILDTADGSAWPSAPRVLVGPVEADGDITPVLAPLTAVVGSPASRASLTLTDAQMATILTAYPVGSRTACPWHVRLGTGEAEVAVSTGYLIWDTIGHTVTTSATLVVGPAGVSVASLAIDSDPESETLAHLLVTLDSGTVVDAGTVSGLISHGDLTSIQGGAAGERYHLTAAQLALVGTAVQRNPTLAAITRDTMGRIVSATIAGSATTLTRDTSGRVATITAAGATRTVTRDTMGRIEGIN